LETRAFPRSPAATDGQTFYPSLVLQAELYHPWAGGKESLVFTPFFRAERSDRERTHFDIRDLAYVRIGAEHEWRIGIGRVFWGVTESQHLVDIINQTDWVENIDGEEKLGQPMINLALLQNGGTLNFFILPGFRERTFPGREGRLRTPWVVDAGRAKFDSRRGRNQIDVAIRGEKMIGDLDLGLSHFHGIGREPRLQPGVDGAGRPVLIPHYFLIHQTGLDLQKTVGRWLWKLEAIHRWEPTALGDDFFAATTGFEYTLGNFVGRGIDLGLLGEYLHDDRGERATTPFQNDVMIGLRLAFNNLQSTEALFGVIVDQENDGQFFSFEGSRRIGEHWKLAVEGRAFSEIAQGDLLFDFRKDDSIEVGLSRYFQ
jgi:hypothetical protein